MNAKAQNRVRALLILLLAVLAFPAIACLGSAAGTNFATESTPVVQNTPVRNISTQSSKTESSPSPPLPSLTTPARPAPQIDQSAHPIVRVAQIVRPAVVNISTQQIGFDFNLRPVPEESGAGSGVIFDKSGYILTNNHVVEEAQGLKVTLPDGRIFDGAVLGADPRTDLAVVKIEGRDFPTAELGDSDVLQIGEPVVAIGNALALRGGPTVTSGIVGALGRTIREPNGAILYDLIQTDAAINPGNSGGPLVNLSGQIVGVNTAIANAPGGGIGFAIAINSARPIAQQLITQGRVVRPWLGISMLSITPSIAARNSLPVSSGVIVTQVQRDSPAARVGLRRLDMITRFDDEQIDDDASLLKALSKRSIGEVVPLTVIRDGNQIVVNITLEQMPQ
ncbi:MAG: trypsin-like peptidase domain-containing protein [Chloroflexi bacterium]|nr:trypsin-like peptidase domain-containing protein [Chloroflexota bacterium]